MIKINKASGILAMSNQWAPVTSYVPSDFWWNDAMYTTGLHSLGDDLRIVKNFIRIVNHDQHNLR